MTTALPRFLAVQHDEFLGRSRAAQLSLDLEKDLFQFIAIDVLHHPAKGRLTGRGITFGLASNAQRVALPLAQAFGEFDQVFLTARRAA